MFLMDLSHLWVPRCPDKRGKDVRTMNLSLQGVASVIPHLFIASLQNTTMYTGFL